MKMFFSKIVLLLVTGTLLHISTSQSVMAAESQNDEWQFQLATYGWLAGQEGSITALNGLPPVDIDLDFWDDILGNINGAMYLIGDARKGPFGIFADFVYTDVEFDASTPGSNFSSASSQSKTWMFTTAAQYRLIENRAYSLDLLAGARYWALESTIALTSGLSPGRKVTNTKSWVDPLVGTRGYAVLGQSKFFIGGFFIIGGFGAGADLMWDAALNFGYNWTEMFSTTFGYRYLDVDYEDDGFIFDVSQHGPTLGLSWRF